MGEIYLPVLSHFQNENDFFSSEGRFRFKVTPGQEGLTAETWEGPWSYEFSAIEEQATFPLDEEGLVGLQAWLVEKAAEVNARPGHTMAEDWARRR